MNPYWLGVTFSAFAFLLQLFWIVYFFGFFRGGFEEWKKRVDTFIERIEGIFYTTVKVVQTSAPETENAPELKTKRSYSAK